MTAAPKMNARSRKCGHQLEEDQQPLGVDELQLGFVDRSMKYRLPMQDGELLGGSERLLDLPVALATSSWARLAATFWRPPMKRWYTIHDDEVHDADHGDARDR